MIRPPAVQKIFREVAARYHVPATAITVSVGGNRAPLPAARAEVAWRLRHTLLKQLSLKQIARYLDCHHSSVIAMLDRAAITKVLDNLKHLDAMRKQDDEFQPDESGLWI